MVLVSIITSVIVIIGFNVSVTTWLTQQRCLCLKTVVWQMHCWVEVHMGMVHACLTQTSLNTNTVDLLTLWQPVVLYLWQFLSIKVCYRQHVWHVNLTCKAFRSYSACNGYVFCHILVTYSPNYLFLFAHWRALLSNGTLRYKHCDLYP